MTRGIGENISEKQNQRKKNRVPPPMLPCSRKEALGAGRQRLFFWHRGKKLFGICYLMQ
jgi:hypothetical protein